MELVDTHIREFIVDELVDAFTNVLPAMKTRNTPETMFSNSMPIKRML